MWQTTLLGILYRITVLLAGICWHLLEQLKFSVKAGWLKIIIAHINFRGFNKLLFFSNLQQLWKKEKKKTEKLQKNMTLFHIFHISQF